MQRGLVHKKLNNRTAATTDLERSVELLPNAPALNALGDLRLANGQRADAIELFRAASKSDSPSGRAAAGSLMRLEFSDKPHLYIKSVVGQDRSGRMVVEVQNPTNVNVEISQLLFQYQDANGQVRENRRNIRQTLNAGKAKRFGIDPRAIGGTRDPRRVRAAVTSAKILEQ